MNALVVGGDSTIGAALARALSSRGDTVVCTSRRPVPGSVFLDLAQPLPEHLPHCDIAFFCAAMAGFAACRASPALAERVNASAPVELAGRLASQGSRVVLLSTSAVFDCAEPRMRAARPYSPRGLYGAQKAQAERGFLRLGAQAAVLRLAKVMSSVDERLAQWRSALRAGQVVRAFDDHRIAPVTLEQAVAALLATTKSHDGGVYQASAVDDLTYAEVAREVAQRCGASDHLVIECTAASAGIPSDEVTPYTSLDCSRLAQMGGFEPPRSRDVLRDVLTLRA